MRTRPGRVIESARVSVEIGGGTSTSGGNMAMLDAIDRALERMVLAARGSRPRQATAPSARDELRHRAVMANLETIQMRHGPSLDARRKLRMAEAGMAAIRARFGYPQA